jgi:hypothetical protein
MSHNPEPPIETKSEEFKRFEELTRKLVTVPKEEIKRRLDQEKREKNGKGSY